MNRTAGPLLLAAAVVATLAGCSSGGAAATGPSDPTAAVQSAARAYQSAANARDWAKACALKSARWRGGTVAQCAAANAEPSSSPTPSATPSPTLPPATYADGSTVPPIASSTPSGPEFASDSPVSVGDVVALPAAGDHPAGYGVMVSFTVTWPGQAPDTDRRALRLVQQGGAWVIDQQDDTITSADQLRTVLGGE